MMHFSLTRDCTADKETLEYPNGEDMNDNFMRKPNVFEYEDYRLYLEESYQFRKSHDTYFSHRYITQKIGASSVGWFSNIIRKRINLTGAYLSPLTRLFKMGEREKGYFCLLVNHNQADSKEEQNIYMDILKQLRVLAA
jgi:uncharacterized protein (TIGR02147 family)